jgi:hypothetical protein
MGPTSSGITSPGVVGADIYFVIKKKPPYMAILAAADHEDLCT